MHDLYVKFMTWVAGEALANSDRVKSLVAAGVGILLVKAIALYPPLAPFLTPENQAYLCNVIAGAAATLVVSLSVRDVGAPGQSVPNAAAGTPTSVVAAAAAASIVAKS